LRAAVAGDTKPGSARSVDGAVRQGAAVNNTILVKKYANRRLYDTHKSAYITVDELASDVRKGAEVKVVDAKTGQDLTQATLAQVIFEGRKGADLLPVSLLVQLVRLGDDGLADFFGRFLAVSVQMYVQARQGAQLAAPVNPFAQAPFQAGDALARMFSAMPSPFFGWPGAQPAPSSPPPAPAAPPPGNASSEDVASLRRELDELKSALRRRRK